MQKMALNVLLSLIIQAKITGKGITSNGKLYVNFMKIIADSDNSKLTAEESILKKFNNEPTKQNAYRKLERYLSRFLKTGQGYPYELIKFTGFEKCIGYTEKYSHYLCAMNKICNKILDKSKTDSLVYTLLEIMRQDDNISSILYGCNYISKEKLFGSYAHPKRICVEALLLGLLYYVHKNPAESENIELLKISEKREFHTVQYRDENFLALEMPINLTDNIRENALNQKSSEMKYQTELKYNNIAVDKLPEKENIFLYGTGGAGKTTFLLNYLKNKNTISFYFPLYQYKYEIQKDFQNTSFWILLQILLKYHYQYEYHTYEALIATEGKNAVLQQLTELENLLKSVPVNDMPVYTLLLDGLNEISSDMQRKFVNELELICGAWKNVRIIITGRTVPDYNLFHNFQSVEICGISECELNSVLSVLPDSGNILLNEELTEILKNPLFLNIYLQNRNTEKQINTRGELLDSYITNFKTNSSENDSLRFIIQFVFPIVAKHMLKDCNNYQTTRKDLLSAVKLALKIYIHNESVYQNFISPKNINKKILLKSNRSMDWVELIINNTGFMEVSESEPSHIHFTHQYFRDYFGAKHILNAIEAVYRGNFRFKEMEKYISEIEISEQWFYQLGESNDFNTNEAYKLIGEISGDYKNIACENFDYNFTFLDYFLHMCRQMKDSEIVHLDAENIIRTMYFSRKKVICETDFSDLKIAKVMPCVRFSMNGKYPCNFCGSELYYFPLFDFEKNYTYNVCGDIMLIKFTGYNRIVVYNTKEKQIVADYDFLQYYGCVFYYVEISEDGKYATMLSGFMTLTFEIYTGKIINQSNDREKIKKLKQRYEVFKNSMPDLDDDFLEEIVSELNIFCNCDFTNALFMQKSDCEMLRKAGAICDSDDNIKLTSDFLRELCLPWLKISY